MKTLFKKLITSASILGLLLLPALVSATTTATWITPFPGKGGIQPSLINGSLQKVLIGALSTSTNSNLEVIGTTTLSNYLLVGTTTFSGSDFFGFSPPKLDVDGNIKASVIYGFDPNTVNESYIDLVNGFFSGSSLNSTFATAAAGGTYPFFVGTTTVGASSGAGIDVYGATRDPVLDFIPLFRISSSTSPGNFTSVFQINANNRIGIGTTTPASLLSLTGTSGIYASTTATSTFQGGSLNLITSSGHTPCYAVNGTCLTSGSSLTGTTGQVAYFSGTNTAVGTSSLFIDTNGSVGINTVTPTAKLDINGTDPALDQELSVEDDDGNQVLFLSGKASDGTYHFFTGGQFTGIEADDSSQTLTMNGSVANFPGLNTFISPQISGDLTYTADITNNQTVFNANPKVGMSFSTNVVSSGPTRQMAGFVAGKQNATSGNKDGFFGIVTSDNTLGLVERLRVNSLGNVGIGTTTPVARLSVVGTSSQPTLPLFDVSTSTGSSLSLFRVDSKGNQYSGGTNVTVTSCGSSAAAATGSNNNAGRITVGTTALQATCTVTFANGGWTATANAPACSVSLEGTSITQTIDASSTATTLVVVPTSGTFTSKIFTYQCSGF